MTFLLRTAQEKDLEALYRMAKGTGGGFTNLPPDKPTLEAKLTRTAKSFARESDEIANDLFVFILEDTESGKVRGTCQAFSQVGTELPFYSYRIGRITQHSKELDRTFRADMLTLCTDLDGASEVGGLYLDATERSAGVGKLLARSRYLFIRMHRARFGDTTLAELRGAIDDAGNSPFWDGLAGRFFDMSFRDADEFNAKHGNQFIADLMPKHPIYTALLSEAARQVMGQPHYSGRPAMRMLENEGFAFQNYVDIFDGGPTMIARTDHIRTVQEARTAPITALVEDDGTEASHLVATGHLATFRACLGHVDTADGGVVLDSAAAALLGVAPGDTITYASA
ncbi:arginine N-succinyltransferase [Novosphingobium aerophilum]|uniref:arginine N-succinyltransferase n=1 Tax=Novosphingobium TaxID=165696 RepID=UPI0006C83917|nr:MULTISPECIES: arginine N-succinyltransferase [unclassified Novosphingobium]KPH60848.1 arginine N-succinyltransferase [Novosphingobium sp. ST904]TCM38420.1 arginine N-succinyltransferase [Novosphingobium sp. ST904]WRT92567.1 arginine N-succinyltransferase [Novosphingobium sp. RL4]